jgi:peptidoglycan/LPS O-acetylase OafA/YrhL
VTPKPRPQYLPALTGLRFVLAMWVILHHLTGSGMMLEQWALTTPAFIQNIFRAGYLAVQTFFLLSGFVLAQSYASTEWNRKSLIKFGMARFARVYPVYLLSLLVVGRFIAETLAKPGRTQMQKAALLGDYGFLLLGWMGPRGVGWNTPAWSLSCEFVFYLCFPLLFLWLRKAPPARLYLALAISFVLPVGLAHAGVPAVWKPIHHISDFVAGIVTARFFDMLRDSSFKAARRGYWLYLPALAAGLALITYPEVLNGSRSDLNTAFRPLNVALVLGFAISGGWIARALSTRVSDYLGQASYSMYILHVPLLWWYSRYAFHKLGAAPHIGASLAFLSIVIGISIAAFELVESPANRWLRDWTTARLQPAPAVASTVYFSTENMSSASSVVL